MSILEEKSSLSGDRNVCSQSLKSHLHCFVLLDLALGAEDISVRGVISATLCKNVLKRFESTNHQLLLDRERRERIEAKVKVSNLVILAGG